MKNIQAGKMLFIIIIFVLPVVPILIISDTNSWLFLILFVLYITAVLLIFKFLGNKISDFIIGNNRRK